jgi:glutamate formiminotransferase/glutamate formiminotransferase/formiminotetrahydrofolate cyclodeaminase
VEFTCEAARFLQPLQAAAKLPVRSDLTVGLTLAIAAGQAGLFTVKTNINSLQNHTLIDEFRDRISKVTEILEELKVLC